MERSELRNLAYRYARLSARKSQLAEELKELKDILVDYIAAGATEFGLRHDKTSKLVNDQKLERALQKLGLFDEATKVVVDPARVTALKKTHEEVIPYLHYDTGSRLVVVKPKKK